MDKLLLQKITLAAFLAAFVVSVTVAAPEQGQVPQDQGRRGGQAIGGGQFGDWFNPAAMQERLLNLYKDQLGVTDEEWTVLLPRLSKVREMNQQMSSMTAMMQWNVLIRPGLDQMMEQSQADNPMAGMVRMFVDRMRRNPQGPLQPAGQEENPVQKALTELQETLAKPSPTFAEIKNKMMAFRGAKEKIRQELALAQKELTDVLTLKQEATLLMLGVLE